MWHLFCTGGEDYAFVNSTIVVPAGTTKFSFNITITDDQILETNESFYLYINSSVPDNVHKDVHGQVQVIILNDDGQKLQIISTN